MKKQSLPWTLCFLWLVFLQACHGGTSGTTFGFFELQIVRVQNTGGELLSGNCCDGTRSDYGCLEDKCDTYFRVCLKELQVSGNKGDSGSCTFGRNTSPVLGSNSFAIENAEDPSNPGRIKIPLMFTWTEKLRKNALIRTEDDWNTVVMGYNLISTSEVALCGADPSVTHGSGTKVRTPCS